MNTTNKIRLLICYYGEFPWYFSFFLHSCKYNPTVDFLIISENKYEHQLPENVTIKNISWEEIKKIISEKLDLNVHIKVPYKLCDFKPAYGFIFQELIEGYDFWGHGDLDIIYGNIRKFITNDVLDIHDLICVRHDFLTGYFTLFKNCKKMNELFRLSKDYEKVFTSPKHYCFDETNFTFEPFTDGQPYNEIQTEIESMTHVVKRLQKEKYINAYFDFHVVEGIPGELNWNKGTLVFKKKYEAILYHLVQFKIVCEPSKIKNVPDNFYIGSRRIHT